MSNKKQNPDNHGGDFAQNGNLDAHQITTTKIALFIVPAIVPVASPVGYFG